jgi:uncharacterized protein with HEPN domain
MLPETDRVRLQHMLEAAREAVAYAGTKSLEDLHSDRPLQHLLIRDITIIGEAAARVDVEFRAAYPLIPWRDIIDTRNRLIHAYFNVNLTVVWKTATEDLPILVENLERIFSEDVRP